MRAGTACRSPSGALGHVTKGPPSLGPLGCMGGSAPGSPPLGAWRRKRRPALSAGGWRQRLRWPVPCSEPERNSPFPARPANLPEEKCDCSRCHQQRQECVSQSVCLSVCLLFAPLSLSQHLCVPVSDRFHLIRCHKQILCSRTWPSKPWTTLEEAIRSDRRPALGLGLAGGAVARATRLAASRLTPCTRQHLHYYPH